MEILWAVLILLGIGLVLGLGLAVAAKILYVKEDERIEEVAKKLPNYNCGSCGYAGCKAMAEAIVTGKEENLKKCKPGKEDLNFKPIIEYLNEHPNEDGTKAKVHL
jgi:electron transport complex protein RnfB